MVKTAFSLVLILGLMFALAYVMRKFVFRGTATASSLVDIEVVGRRALHPKRSVYVLKVMNRILVVGMSEHGMQTLGEISDEPALAELEKKKLALEAARTGGTGHAFTDYLQNYAPFLVRKTGHRVHEECRDYQG